MRQSWILMVAITISLITAACSSAIVQPPPPQATAPGPKAPPGAGWEQKWQTTLAEARREGIVRVYTNWGARTRTSLSQNAFGLAQRPVPFRGQRPHDHRHDLLRAAANLI
ncbi:MAG: hypothetical protein HY673_23880 [Chloroflexi bacterium]|nr:hypothetical protein [Chloroflexota bacterium]